jgi:hypothetical protein
VFTGDLMAQVAAGRLGGIRLNELFVRYGTETVLGYVDELLERAETLTRRGIEMSAALLAALATETGTRGGPPGPFPCGCFSFWQDESASRDTATRRVSLVGDDIGTGYSRRSAFALFSQCIKRSEGAKAINGKTPLLPDQSGILEGKRQLARADKLPRHKVE